MVVSSNSHWYSFIYISIGFMLNYGSGGYFGKVRVTVSIPSETRDQHLLEKLKAEAPQILHWAIDGALQ